MPSPIAHCSLFLPFWEGLRRRLKGDLPAWRRWFVGLALLVGLMGPDADALLGLASGAGIGRYHNGPSHALLFGFLFGVLFMGLCRWCCGCHAKYLFVVGWAAYTSHILLDACTCGSGVQLFWPITNMRFRSPLPLFIGVRHSVNAPLYIHVLTVLNDLAFAVFVWMLYRFIRRRHTP